MPATTTTTTLRTLAASALLAATGAVAASQPAAQPQISRVSERLDVLAHTPPAVYNDQCVVSVRVETLRQLRAVHTLIESSWTERPGLGEIVVQIRRDRLPALEALGLDPEIRIDDLQAHADERWERRRAAAARDRVFQLGAQAPSGAWTHDDAWFADYKQYADVIAYFDAMAAARPDLVAGADIGDSIQARDILAYTISAPDEPGNAASDRPAIIFNGTQHAREWMSPMTVTYIASRLVDGFDTETETADLLRSVRFVIVPVVNPDGYLYSWSNERFWRKNRRDNAGTSSDGVDLNRNWGIAFGGAGTSPNPGSDVYPGTAPFSEPETDAMRALAASLGDDLAAHIDYHSFSQLILWPLGYESGLVTPEPDRSFFENLSGDMSSRMLSVGGAFYDPIQSWRLYPAAGTASDWFYDARGATSFTIELRPSSAGAGGFDPPASQILPTAQENFEAAKLFASRTTRPLVFEHDAPNILEPDAPTPVTLSARDALESLDPMTVTLWSRTGTTGPFAPAAMTPQGGTTYGADLPRASCGEPVAYYFSADTVSGDTITFPAAGAASPITALAQQTTLVVLDDMETDTGWSVGAPSDTADTGIWERADPQGTDAQPADDHTPSGTLCWVTGASATSLGSNDIDEGATTLTSPALDASDPDAELTYWRWYSNDQGASPNADAMLVEISEDDGATWTTLETVVENTGAWTKASFRVADVAAPSSELRVRFIASDLGDGSVVEAAIDDLRIETIGCPGSAADLNGDGSVTFADVSLFLGYFTDSDPRADFTGDGAVTFADVSAFLSAFAAG